MRSIFELPGHVPAPALGSWFYLIICDSMHDGLEYHSCGTIERVVVSPHDAWVEYRNDWSPTYGDRPIRTKEN